MKNVKYLLLSLVAFVCHLSLLQSMPLPLAVEQILHNLPFEGKILKTPEGFVYVKVDDHYIRDLALWVAESGFEEPPYFGPIYDQGAHISIIYPTKTSPINIVELGETIQFQVVGSEIFETANWKGVEKVLVLLVESERLQEIQEKYGLPKDHLFHITVGISRSS